MWIVDQAYPIVVIFDKYLRIRFTTWVSHVRDLANMHNVEMYKVGDLKSYKARCKSAIVSNLKKIGKQNSMTWTNTR